MSDILVVHPTETRLLLGASAPASGSATTAVADVTTQLTTGFNRRVIGGADGTGNGMTDVVVGTDNTTGIERALLVEGPLSQETFKRRKLRSSATTVLTTT